MKTLLAILLTASIASAQYVDLRTMTVHSGMTDSVVAAWARFVPSPRQPPEGYASITQGWDIANGYATPILSFYPAPITPDVQTYTVPVEMPVLILSDAATNASYSFYSVNGVLVGGVFDHASPRDPVAISNRLAQAKARYDVVRGEIGGACLHELILAAERANNARLNDAFRILARRVPAASNALQAVIWTPQQLKSNIVERLP